MSIESKATELEKDLDSSPPPEEKTTMNETAKKPPKKKVAAKKKANGHAKEADLNQTTLAQLCKQLKIDPRLARRKLRDAELKAEGRWSWKTGSNDLKKVEKILTAEPAE